MPCTKIVSSDCILKGDRGWSDLFPTFALSVYRLLFMYFTHKKRPGRILVLYVLRVIIDPRIKNSQHVREPGSIPG